MLDAVADDRKGESQEVGSMTRTEWIQAAIWTPAAITVALTAMYWDGTGQVSWVGEVLVGLALLTSGVLGLIYDRRKIMPRNALKQARLDAGMTQREVAEHLHVGERHYKKIESCKIVGSITLWDMLEDLFRVHQRTLREISENHHGKANNQ